MPDRFNGYVGSEITLNLSFFKKNQLANAYWIKEVNVYSRLNSFQKSLIQTVPWDKLDITLTYFENSSTINESIDILGESITVGSTLPVDIDTSTLSNDTELASNLSSYINNNTTLNVLVEASPTDNTVRVNPLQKVDFTSGTLGSTEINVAHTVNIVNTSTGVYEVNVGPFTVGGEYEDEFVIFPEPSSEGNYSAWNTFFIYEENPDYSYLSDTSLDMCMVYGRLARVDGRPIIGAEVIGNITQFPSQVNGTNLSLTQHQSKVYTDRSGRFKLLLPKNVKVFIAIPDILLKTYTEIPDQDSVNIFTLVSVEEIGDTTADITTGEDAW